jgi:acyl-CoA thioester hydrolase
MQQEQHTTAVDNRRMIEHTTHIRVRYADTDQMSLVYYGKYFEYFEVARTEMLRAAGLPYSEIERAGFALPVRDASIRYYTGATYDDLLRISARMEATVGTRLPITYTIHKDATNELVAEGATTLVFVSQATGKPSKPPEIYRQVIEKYIHANA